jgi:hypothetical protein
MKTYVDNLNAVDSVYLNQDYCESILKKNVRDFVIRITQIQDYYNGDNFTRSVSRVKSE